MVFFQIFLFLWVALVRGPRLFGRHLKPVKGMPGCLQRKLYLYFTSRQKIREQYAEHIGVEVKGGMIPFVVRKERWYHRYLKKVGLANEIAIPDAVFDRKYYVTTDFPNHLEVLMADGPLLADLKALMDLKVKAIHVGLGRVWCVLGDWGKPPEKYEAHFELMRKIGRAVLADSHRPKRHRLLGLVSAVLVVHVAVFVCGVSGYLPLLGEADVIDDKRVLGYGLLASGLAIVMWQALLVGMFKGTSWLGWVMADFWIWGMTGLLLGGAVFVREANMDLPQPPARLYVQTVISKDCVLHCTLDCGRRCTKTERHRYVGERACHPQMRETVRAFHLERSEICRASNRFGYELLVTSWRNEDVGQGYRVDTRERVFDAVREGGGVGVPVHPGALGMEWVDPREVRP